MHKQHLNFRELYCEPPQAFNPPTVPHRKIYTTPGPEPFPSLKVTSFLNPCFPALYMVPFILIQVVFVRLSVTGPFLNLTD